MYRAEDTRLGRAVALKFLPQVLAHDEASKDRLLLEARAAATLDHPNVCTVYDVAETEAGQPYIALACYDGETLADRLARGPLAADEAVRVAGEIASGVAAAHARGIIHRDLKPSNVFLCEDGTAKVLDFGVAKVPGVSLTKTGHTAGTIAYGAPEQSHGAVDARSDVWAIGVVLYEMLTGERPFAGSYESAVLYAVLHETPPPPSTRADVPPALDAVVARCLAKSPEDRYPDAAALADALGGVSGPASPVGFLSAAGRPPALLDRLRQSKSAWVAAALVLMGLVGAALWSARGGDSLALPAAIHLAVLPPVPRPDADGDVAFAEGLAEELASGVVEIRPAGRDVTVVPVSEVRALAVSSPRQAGATLGANLALTGTLRRQGDRLTLTLELATTGERPGILDTETIEVSSAQESTIRGRALLKIAEMLEFDVADEDDVRLTSGTDDPEAQEFYFKGLSYLERDRDAEDLDRAVFNFEQAIAVDSMFVEAHARLAEAAVAKYTATLDPSWIERARTAGDRALSLDSVNPTVFVALSTLASATGETPQAMRYARRALAIDSTDRALLALAAAQEAGSDLEGAEETYLAMIRRAPASWLGPHRLGWFYLNQFRLDEAEAQFEREIQLAPDNFKGYLRLGAARHYAGNAAGAREAYEQAIALRPDHPDAYSNLGTLLLAEGDTEGAVERYRQALAHDSTNHAAWRNLAAGYSTINDDAGWMDAMRGARRRADLALSVNPNAPRLLASAAMYREGTGDEAGAREAAAQAARLAPDNPLVLFDAAVVFARLGDLERALETLAAASDAGHSLAGIETLSAFSSFEEDPRFVALVAGR